MNLRAKRKITNGIALTLSLLAMTFGLVWLLWILFEVVRLGFGGLSIDLFTKMTPAPGSDGGLLNAIVGSLIMVTLATLIGTPIGIMAGIYLAEYDRHGWLGFVTRFINDILLSAIDRDWFVCLRVAGSQHGWFFGYCRRARTRSIGDTGRSQNYRKYVAISA